MKLTTPVSAAATRTRYDDLAIWLHWLTALLVVALFILSEFWGVVPHPTKTLMVATHMSLGILLALVLVVRIVWRLTPGHRVKDANIGLLELASKTVHNGLYVLLAAQMVLGFLTRWTDNKALSFFGLLIPSPIGTFSKAAGDFVDTIHNVNAWIIMVLAAGHVLAALMHHFVLRDDVLLRILPSAGGQREPSPEKV